MERYDVKEVLNLKGYGCGVDVYPDPDGDYVRHVDVVGMELELKRLKEEND